MPEYNEYKRITDIKSGEVMGESSNRYHASNWFDPAKGYKLYGRGRPKLGKRGYNGLTMQQKGLVLDLLLLVDKGNMLPSFQRIEQATGLGKRQVYRLIADLHKKGIIGKLLGSYYLNPSVGFAGIYLGHDLYRLFQVDLDRIVPTWAKLEYATKNTVSDVL